MADETLLIGRDDAMMLVRDLTDRPLIGGRRRSRLRPVLVVEGARGTGKSALLRHIAGQLDQRAPYARLDFEASPAADVPEVLSAVAFALGRYVPKYDAISFPRLAIARLVMQQTLDLSNHKAASRQVTDLLVNERGLNTLRAGLGRAAGTAVNVLQGQFNLPDELRTVLRDATDEAARGAWTTVLHRRKVRRIALGASVRWFGHRDRDLRHDPVDVLIELNRWADDPGAGDQRQAIDELVWDAFLTDLRQHFRSNDADDWRLNCVLVMDNGDTRVGQEFVTSLVRNRGTRRNDPDPLTAVVTSTGALLAYRDPQEITDAEADDTENGWQRFRRHHLSDLSPDDIVNLIANTGLRSGNTPRLPIMIHQLTEGHPAATQLMITTIAQHETIRDDPRKLLAQQEPGAADERKSVANRLREALLGEFPRDSLDELITCAAADDVEHRRALATLIAGSDRLLAQIDDVLWAPVGGAGPRVLRRLLLPLLAERDDTHPTSWRKTFTSLRAGRAKAGDERHELYYSLALGDLSRVVVGLEKHLERLDSQQWCELLLAVTAAPRRRPGAIGATSPTPDHQFRDLLRHSDPAWSSIELARLVAALWIVNDPMTDARRRGLHIQIANDYEWLAGHSQQNNVQGYRQNAHRHRQHAEIWPWN